LLDEFHSTPIGDHSSTKPTVTRLVASFFWPGLYRDTKLFVQSYTICQQSKYLPTKKQGLLQALPVSEQVWEDIIMDCITHLPASFGHTTIWVIYDRLTKYGHFIALPSNYTA